MTGATLNVEFDSAALQSALGKLKIALDNIDPALRDMGEHLMLSHRLRFADQTAPDGTPWAPLSPAYKKQKKKNKNKILFLDGYLQNTLRYQLRDGELLFGSNRKYAALMQFGGVVQRKARKQDVYFKQNADGSVGNKFVKKKNSNFAQTINVGAHSANYTARPFLGVSESDSQQLVNIVLKHLKRAAGTGGL